MSFARSCFKTVSLVPVSKLKIHLPDEHLLHFGWLESSGMSDSTSSAVSVVGTSYWQGFRRVEGILCVSASTQQRAIAIFV